MAPEELLTLGSKSALYRLFQDYLDTYYPGYVASWYIAANPVVVEGTLTSVLFTLDRMSTPVDKWNSIIEFTIRYNRLELDRVITADTPIPVSLPADHYTVTRAYLDRVGIPLDPDDMDVGSVSTHGEVVVVTNVNSYRWVGAATITTVPDERSLSDIAHHKRIVTNFSEVYSSAQVKRDLITHLNVQNRGRGLPPVTFEDVQVCCPVSEGLIDDKTNTRVKILSISGLYRGEVDLRYRRRHFTYTWRKPLEVLWNDWSDVHSSLPAISEALGCQIVSADVLDVTYPPPAYKQPVEVVIHFKPESMGYLGELKVMFHV